MRRRLFGVFALWLLVVAGPPCLRGELVINEFMASNGLTLADEDGDFEDWIEIYNPGSEVVDVGGWGLSDDPSEPFRWVFPSMWIEPGGHQLVWASGKDRSGFGEGPPPLADAAPDDLPGLVAWFRADALVADDGDPVAVWSDSSGMGNEATQSNVGQRPVFIADALDDLPAVSFAGGKQMDLPRATFNGLENLENFTFVAVARWDGGVVSGLWGTGPSGTTSGNLHFEIESGGTLRLRVGAMNSVRASGTVQSGWRVLGATQDSSFEDPLATVFVDGSAAATRSEDTGHTDLGDYGGFFLGNSHDSPRNFDGLIAEVAIYDRALDVSELAALDSHLKNRYGLDGTAPTPDRAPHTNFRISAEGEPLVLTRPDGIIADSIAPVPVPRDTSYGRQPDGGPDFHFFLEPTPGTANVTQTYTAPVDPPDFSVQRGFYNAPFALELSHPDPEVEIRFSTDGSAPGPDAGTLFSSPLDIDFTSVVRAYAHKEGALPTSKVETHSYFFLSDILAQRDDPAALGFPTTWGSWIYTHYGFEPDVVEDPAYAPLMEGALTSIPTLSLVMEMDDLFDPDTGIYANRTRRGVEWERPVSVELIHPDGSRADFQINAGIRAQGGASRNDFRTPKGSLRLLFKNIYETGTLEYPFFEEQGTEMGEFNSIILRAEYNNEWLHPNGIGGADQRSRGQYVRDQFIRNTQIAMSGHGSHSKHVHLYLNGVYWGLYNPSERADAFFGASYFGGEREDWDAITHRGVRDGNGMAWSTLNSRAGADLSVPGNYESVLEYIDVEQYIDYMIVNLWAGMNDWPNNNWNAIRRREPGNGFMFFCWDAERSMEEVNENRTGVSVDAARFYHRMRANPEFRLAFADRVQKHFFGAGALTPAETIARYEAGAAVVETAVIAESARWGSYRRDKHTHLVDPSRVQPPAVLYTRDEHWLAEYHRLINDYLPQRTGIVLQQFRNADLYPSIDAPDLSLGGGQVLISSPLPFFYSTEEMDPRLPGGAVAPSAMAAAEDNGTYQASVPVHLAFGIRARALEGGEWSALSVGTASPDLPDPVIIHHWDFEASETFLLPGTTVGGDVGIAVDIDPDAEFAEVIRNTAAQGFDSAHLRVNEPLDVTLTWNIPTTGFEGILVNFDSRRSNQGAGEQVWEYTTDGETWQVKETLAIQSADPVGYELDFRGDVEVGANPDFALRVTFAQGEGGVSGNNRFDDFSVSGFPVANGLPPASIVFDTVPGGTVSGSPLGNVVVRLLDADGNPAIAFDGPVTLFLVGDGVLTGTTTVDAIFGTATFDDLVITGSGAFQLTADAAGLDPAVSGEFFSASLTELVLPRFIQGDQDVDNNNLERVPYAFRLRLDGLRPNATYRFGNRVVLATDEPDNNGAGNAIYITGASADWVRNTNAPRFREDDLGDRHWTFATDAEGSYTGWFVTEPTGNARFTSGNELHMRLLLNDGQGGEATAHILTTESSATVMRFGSGLDEGTGVVGQTSAAARRMVVVYDETAGSTRPLAATPVEITGSQVDDRYVTFYETVVATNPNHWGTIVPNDLPGGVQRIEVLGLTGDAILDLRVDGDGLAGTLNPDSGTAPILLDAGAGLPRFLPGGNGSWNDAVNWSTQSVPDGDGQSAILNAPIGGNRAVTLDAPVTVGNLRVEQDGSAFRNRINSAGEIESLTFSNDSQPAQLRVLGNGAGFVEFDLTAPVDLADTLRVIVDHLGNETDDAFGGLRLRGTWQGAGGLTKQGVGIASLTGGDKDFEGAIVIEQGALRITEPATPANTSSVTVLEGGQLRLVSGSSPGEPRIHTFGGGAISLAGLGRGGDLPGGEELGVLGALRYDPSSNDNHAILTNAITLNGDTDIHTDGTRNLLEIQGAVGGSGKLIKTGGGALRLSADSPGFGGPMEVENGLLEVDGNMGGSAVSLGADGVLGGGGEVGTISGAGSVEPGTSHLTAPQSGAAGYAFVFAAPGATAGNGTLELAATPALTTDPGQIDIYLNVAELETGDVFYGGLLVDAAYDLESALSGTTVNLFVAEEEGEVAYRGGEYRAALEADELSWSVADTAEGRLIEVRVGQEVRGFEAWRGDNFTAAELEDETVSGPQADPSGMGVPNLMRYALGLGRDDAPWSSLPELTGPPADAFRFPFDPAKTDITYRVLASTDLVDWSEVVFDSSEPHTLEPVDGVLEVPVSGDGPRRFFRLEVQQ